MAMLRRRRARRGGSRLSRRRGGSTRIIERVRSGARRIASHGDTPMYTAWGAGGVLGYLRGKGTLAGLPTIAALGAEGTIAAAAWFFRKKSKYAAALATAAGAITLYDMGKTMASGASPTGVSGARHDEEEVAF